MEGERGQGQPCSGGRLAYMDRRTCVWHLLHIPRTTGATFLPAHDDVNQRHSRLGTGSIKEKHTEPIGGNTALSALRSALPVTAAAMAAARRT